MRRLTISIDDDLADTFDELVNTQGYANRSEAFRDLLRQDLGNVRLRDRPDEPCIATLSYVYNHHQRQLASRLADFQHEHHDLTVSTMHVHLDHEHCLETVILRGRTEAVQAFADAVIAQPGVSHGSLHRVPMVSHHAHGHAHMEPATAHAAGERRPGRPSGGR